MLATDLSIALAIDLSFCVLYIVFGYILALGPDLSPGLCWPLSDKMPKKRVIFNDRGQEVVFLHLIRVIHDFKPSLAAIPLVLVFDPLATLASLPPTAAACFPATVSPVPEFTPVAAVVFSLLH
jgi:hypothetical protein